MLFFNTFSTIRSPLDQFELRDLISLDAPILGNLHISVSNIGLYLVIAAFLGFSMSILSTNFNKLVSNN
jgi:F-type H+-transporting ATPase subunit a